MWALKSNAVVLLGAAIIILAACGPSADAPTTDAPTTDAPTTDAPTETLTSDVASPTTQPATGTAMPIAIAAGGEHTCALLSDGGVMCWGNNQYGQLGDGTVEDAVTPVQAIGISDAIAIEAGAEHTCAVLASGGVVCWGAGAYGRLGNGELDSAVPLPVSGIDDAVDIAAGPEHTCAVLADGGVMCWGFNGSGQLGNGTDGPSAEPQLFPFMVSGIQDAIAISAGGAGGHRDQDHTCALLSGGGVSCWGYGIAGDATRRSGPTPEVVAEIADATAIASAYYHACAQLAGGGVSCWGGDTPVAVEGITDATAIAGGGATGARYGFTCAVRAGGDVACWAGFSTPRQTEPTPSKVLGIADATDVAVGVAHACALLTDGGVMCWINFQAPVLERVVGLASGGPTGTPAPALSTMTISWDGSSCAFDTSSVDGAGNTRLVMDNQTDARVSGTLVSIAAGHTVDEVAAFLQTYDGVSEPPAWLVVVAGVDPDSPYNQSDRVSVGREALVDLAVGTYGAFCFDPGLAGYVLADGQLAIEP